jgi:fused signal recognition particle receptor
MDLNTSFLILSYNEFFKKIFSSEKKDLLEQAKETLDKGLEKSKTNFFRSYKAVAGKSKVDEEVLDNLRRFLLLRCGCEYYLKIITRIENRVAADKYVGTDELNQILGMRSSLLSETNTGESTQFVIPTNQTLF